MTLSNALARRLPSWAMTTDISGEVPFADAVDRYLTSVTAPFSTPGHKRNPALIGADPLLLCDAPHHGGADDLRSSLEVLERAEALAAAAWNADFARFSHNGSTHPNQALCLAATRPGEPVLVSRTCHKSVYAGLILSGARPVWVTPDVDDVLGLPLGVRAEQVATGLVAEPGVTAAILVEPSYVGVMSDVAAFARSCHGHGIPLIVDHAWAAHFGFADNVPQNALTLGADAMAISIHKTLTSFTPGALLLARATGRIDLERLAASFDALLTTSPSGTIYGSIDRARELIARRGPELLVQAERLARAAGERISAIDGVRVLDDAVLAEPSVAHRDPLKLVLDLSRSGADGIELDRFLRADGIQLEGADRRTVVPLITIGDDEARVAHLCDALERGIAAGRGFHREPPAVATSWRSLPPQAMTPREAFFAPSERVPAEHLTGRVSAEFVVPYPPGIPALAPGEVVEPELYEALQSEAAAGTRMASASDPTLRTLLVVAK